MHWGGLLAVEGVIGTTVFAVSGVGPSDDIPAVRVARRYQVEAGEEEDL